MGRAGGVPGGGSTGRAAGVLRRCCSRVEVCTSVMKEVAGGGEGYMHTKKKGGRVEEMRKQKDIKT